MSGRIRTIKPELLEDEKTAALTDLEFRLFVSLLLLADDHGNLRAEPGFVRGQALWATPHGVEAVRAALESLVEAGLVRPYDVRGQRYLHIAGWKKHQRVDKPGKPRVPGPDDPEVAAPREWRTYFLRLGADGPIKIGKTIDVAGRVAKLQTSAPDRLHVLAVVGANVEAECHRRFAPLRTHGEWFRPEPELLAYLDEISTKPARESFANHSRAGREPLAPDLRSPTSGPPNKEPEPEARTGARETGGSKGGQGAEVGDPDAEPHPAADPPEPSPPPAAAAPTRANFMLRLVDPNEPPPPPPAHDPADPEVPMAFRDDHTLTLPGLDTPEAPRRSDAPPSRQAGARRAPGRGTRGEPPAGAEGVKNDPGALIEAEAEPAEETTETQRMGDDKARYAKHFAIGVRSVTGDAGFGLLSGEYGELADICTRRALSPEGKRLMKGKLDAWLEENAAAFARETSGERRKFNPLTPRSFERWLRDKAEGAPAQAQRHPGTYHGQMVQTDEAARRERDRLAKNPNPNTAALDRHIAELEASGVNVDGDDWEFANFGAKRAAGAR